MRQELIDLVFGIVENLEPPNPLPPDRLYRVISQSLGMAVAGDPYGGYRYATGRDIGRVEWPRVYDLISRLWPLFGDELREPFLEGVNRILAGYGAAWELRADGRLHRVLPVVAAQNIEAAIAELQDARYIAARALLTAAIDAYDARPRRDRDVCANAFDALESVTKTKYGMPNDTFFGVLNHLRGAAAFNPQVLAILEAINTLRNRNFGHGMVAPPNLTQAEVDFTYLMCISAVLLITRTP
jgi:hypothetical protein